jgi:hypothetical protein
VISLLARMCLVYLKLISKNQVHPWRQGLVGKPHISFPWFYLYIVCWETLTRVTQGNHGG